MLDCVIGIITRYNMFHSGQRIGVAVSGGADSVCLLHVLVELAPRWELRLHVLHLDHGLRGEESRQDADFVEQMAARQGLPCITERVDLTDAAGNLEQAARRARYDFFLRCGMDRVALGHTRSDQAETVLFRFLRGAGTAGLAGIRPVTSDGFVRPLLGVNRADVERYLRERRIAWREDSTNRSPAFSRNRIRWELLPMLSKDWNPSLAETLAQTADWALAEESYWDAEMDRLAAAHLVRKPPAVLLRVEDLAALPLAVARRLVRRAVELVKGDLRSLEFRHVNGVLSLASIPEGSGRLQIPGLDVFRSYEWLRLAPPGVDTLENRNFRFPLPAPGRATLPGGGVIRAEVIEATASSDSRYNGYVGCLDWDRLPGSLELRNWRPGDQYRPIGHTGEDKIKTLFQQARIPLWERRSWPVVTCGEAIVWTRLFGPAAAYTAHPDSRALLRISEIGT